MGKKQRNGVRTLSADQRVTTLGRAATLIGELNAGRARCFEAVALLDRVARLLEVRAEPLAVALLVQGPTGSCMLGEAASDLVVLAEGATPRRGRHYVPERWNGAGHLILYAAKGSWLFDPSFNQVSEVTGLRSATFVQQASPAAIANGDLAYEIEGGQLLYRIVRADRTWETAYHQVYAGFRASAVAVAQRALELEGFDENLVQKQ